MCDTAVKQNVSLMRKNSFMKINSLGVFKNVYTLDFLDPIVSRQIFKFGSFMAFMAKQPQETRKIASINRAKRNRRNTDIVQNRWLKL